MHQSNLPPGANPNLVRSKRRIRTAFESKSRVIDPKHDQEATKHTLMKTPSVLYFSEVFKDDLFPKGKHVAVHPGNMSCSLGDEGRCLNVKSERNAV